MEDLYHFGEQDTLDECPWLTSQWKIIANVQDTVEIIETIKPIYNFKAAE